MKHSGGVACLFLVFIFFWTIAIFMWCSVGRSPSHFWAAFAFFFFGCGGLAAVLNDYAKTRPTLQLVVGFLSSLNYFWAPFSLLIFSLYDSGWMTKKKLRHLLVLLLCAVPAISAYFVFPAIDMFKGPLPVADRIRDTQIMTIVILPYYLLVTIILLMSWLREKDRVLRADKSVSCLLVIPSALLYYCLSYLIPSTGVVGAWRISIVLIIGVSVLFVGFGIRQSVMGLHFHQENTNLEQTKQAVIQGTGVLLHAIKNNLLSLRLSLQNAQFQSAQGNPDLEVFKKDIALAMESCEHTLAILDRIHLQFQPIRITPEMCAIIPIIDQAINQSLQTYPHKNIRVDRSWEISPRVFCDPVHIRETILNLTNNAMEAMNEDTEGHLSVRTFDRRGKLGIQITDNGCGITRKQTRYLGTPLFTTKVGKNHFGLGLYYVKKVADLHDAQFDLRTLPKGGSVAELVFPANRISGGDSVGGAI